MIKEIFQKTYILLILSLFTLIFCERATAQIIPGGLYEIDYKVDTAVLHSRFKRYNQQPENRPGFHQQNIYSYEYKPMIDSAYRIRYAVVSSKADNNNRENYNLQFILLNDNLPKNYSVSYGDTLHRKFIAVELIAGLKSQAWNEVRYTGDEGLFQYPDFGNSNAESSYRYNFDPANFYAGKDQFILRSHRYELVRNAQKVDSSTYYSNPLADSGYQTSTTWFNYKQPVVTFKLSAKVPYRSFLVIKRRLKFYTDPNDHTRYQYLNEGDFMGMTKETDEWYWGEYISVKGERTAGRIFIDDLSAGKVKIQKINGLELKIRYTPFEDTDTYTTEKGTVEGIKVYRNKRLLQVIKNPGLINDNSQPVSTADVNFDGYPDLVVFGHDGGAGPNYGYNYYLYNPKTQRFDYHTQLSELSQPMVNGKSKSIAAAWRNGAGNHGFEKYKWIKGKLTLVEYYETRYLDEEKVEETHQVLLNGKMKGRSRVVKENQLKFPVSVTQ